MKERRTEIEVYLENRVFDLCG